MAFPTTGILDDFARADENPLTGPASGGGTWTSPPWAGAENLKLFTGLCYPDIANPASIFGNSAVYSTTFGPDVEVYVSLQAAQADFAAGITYLGARLTTIGASTTNGYVLHCPRFRSGTDEWRFFKIV